MDLFEAISQAVTADNDCLHTGFRTPNKLLSSKQIARPSSDVVGTARASTKPILQLNALPVTINPSEYQNPLSTANPNGNLEPLWAFRQLVDPIPVFSRYYSPSLKSTETTYAAIVNGSTISEDTPFTANVIAQAQKSLSQNRYANMDRTPGTWAPVYAIPDDWYTTTNGRYKTLDFDLKKAGDPSSPFAKIGGHENLIKLKIAAKGSSGVISELDPTSKINKITLRYLQVNLNRPWFDKLLFDTAGWHLSGQASGFCSSGKMNENPGVIPLIPTSVVLACDVSVDAKWSSSDQQKIDQALSQGHQVSLDQLLISPSSQTPSIQVIAWVSSLIPLSPQDP